MTSPLKVCVCPYVGVSVTEFIVVAVLDLYGVPVMDREALVVTSSDLVFVCVPL